METNIHLETNTFEAVDTAISNVELDGKPVLRAVKSEKIMEFDENTYAKVVDFSFHNGSIEVEMLSRLLPEAPDFARGFIGIAYRINEDDTKFESFYVRLTNGRTENLVRKARGCQYFSYPTYTFDYFRNNNISTYAAPADIGLNEWIKLTAIIENEHAECYINDGTEPVLVVADMKHGANQSGGIGFFVDIETEAFFRQLKIIKKD